jgi:hypothetical protein
MNATGKNEKYNFTNMTFSAINKKINRKNDCFNRGLHCFAPYPADFLPAALSGFCLEHPGFR